MDMGGKEMKKFVVTKKCYASEFVFVEAENEEEAITKADKGDYTKSMSTLEWNGYLPKDEWLTEELKSNGLEYNEEKNG